MSDRAPRLRRSRGGVLDLSDPALGEILAAVVDRGVAFRFAARGSSMHPLIKDGDVVTAMPLGSRAPRIGDVIVFRGGDERLVVHRVVRRVPGGGRAGHVRDVRLETRGDNRPQSDGLVPARDVLGVVTRVDRDGRAIRFGVGAERMVLAACSRRSALQPLLRHARAVVGSRAARPAADRPGPLPPETRALLYCAQVIVGTRDPADFRAAVAACPSAERLCREAVRHGMLGHLYRLVHEQEDTSFVALALERLERLYRQSAALGLTRSAYLLRLLDHLRARGIDTMPIKGPAWAERLYGDISLRHWEDLDLLVRHEQVPAARKALMEAGFRDWTALNPMIMRRARRAEGEMAFISTSDNDLWVDLHWEIGVGPGARGLSAHHLIARAETGELLGREILTPTRTDVLLITCVQGTRDGWSTVEALLGLGVQVRALPAASWPDVMAAARAAGCARRVLIGVAHACRVLGLTPPQHMAELLSHDATARRLLASLTPSSLLGGPVRGRAQQFDKLRWLTESSDSLGAAAGQVFVRAVRPSPDDWRLLTLPARLHWLYWVIRPARLALKWARHR